MLFQALGLYSEQDRRSIFTLFLNSEFLGNAVELQDPDPDWAANCRLLQQQFWIEQVEMAAGGQVGDGGWE